MERTAVNPWEWSIKLGYNQAEVIDGATRQVICAGQTAVDENGAPQHLDDMRAQIQLALDNLVSIPAQKGSVSRCKIGQFVWELAAPWCVCLSYS